MKLRHLMAVPLVLALQLGSPSAGLAATEPGWHPPLDLSPGYLYSYPQIAAGGDGGFLHAWEEKQPGEDSRLTLHAREVPAVGPPGVPRTIPGLTFFGASLAADGQGDAVLAWDEHEDYCCVTLSAAIKEGGNWFAEPIDVDYGSGVVVHVRTAMNSLGDAAIAYSVHYSDNTEALWVAFRPAGGEFGDPILLMAPVPSSNLVHDLHIALSDTGEAVIGWSTMDGIIKAAVATESGVEDSGTLSDPSQDSYRVAVAVDSAGGAVVGWNYPNYENSPPGGPVYVAVRAPGSGFGEPLKIGDANEEAEVDADASADGRALISFITNDFRVAVQPVSLATGALGEQTVFPEATGWARVSVGPQGEALVVLEDPIDLGVQPYQAATRVAWGDASGCFGPMRILTPSWPWYSLTDSVIGPQGNAAVLLLARGANVPDDTDDRSAVARSDTALASNPSACDGGEAPVPPPDEGTAPPPPIPEVELLVPGRLHARHDGRFPVEVLSSAAGKVTLSGRIWIGKEKDFLGKDSVTLSAPGAAKLHPRVVGDAMRALEAAGKRGGDARLIATLRAAGQRVKVRASVGVWR